MEVVKKNGTRSPNPLVAKVSAFEFEHFFVVTKDPAIDVFKQRRVDGSSSVDEQPVLDIQRAAFPNIPISRLLKSGNLEHRACELRPYACD